MKKKILGIAAALLFSANASAALITFTFGSGTGSLIDPGANQRYYTDTVSGVTVTVTGWAEADLDGIFGPIGGQRDVTRGSRGLGVAGNGNGQVNGAGTFGDALKFDLSQSGTLVGITLRRLSSNEEFDLAIDDVAALNNVSSNPWSGSLAYINNLWIGADSSNEDFRVKAITVDVPEPGTLGLLALGLIGLGLARRRA